MSTLMGDRTTAHLGKEARALQVWGGQGGQGLRERWAGRRRTVIGHGEDGDLSDGSAPARHAARPLIDGGQVCVHVSGEASAPRHLLPGS